jgi:hypothetical protein
MSGAGVFAVFYALIWPTPWAVIPLNAALHATGTAMALRIIRPFVRTQQQALWCVVPYMMWPSAMSWYAQLHKEVFATTGVMVALYGLAQLSAAGTWQRTAWGPIRAVGWVVLGSVLVSIARPYVVHLLQVALVLVGTYAVLRWLIWVVQRKAKWHWNVIAVICVGVMSISLGSLTKIQDRRFHILQHVKASPQVTEVELPDPTVTTPPALVAPSQPYWRASGILPARIEDKLSALALARDWFRVSYPTATSNIDTEIALHSAGEMLGYLPRAAQIALFSPFPRDWVKPGRIPQNTLMRRVAAMEMLGVYLALYFLPYAMWVWRRCTQFWTLVVCCLGFLIMYGFVTTNMGAIYRFRYPYLMVLVMLGCAGLVAFLDRVRLCRSSQEAHASQVTHE